MQMKMFHYAIRRITVTLSLISFEKKLYSFATHRILLLTLQQSSYHFIIKLDDSTNCSAIK